MCSGRPRSSCLATIFITIALCYSTCAKTANSQTTKKDLRVFPVGRASHPEPDYVKLRAALLAATAVPLKLPTFLPFIDAANPIAASLVSVNQSGYEIALGWGEGCFSVDLPSGAGACHYGMIRGSSGTLIENEGRRVPVNLTDGIRGYFVGFTCGANCDDAAIGWTQGGYHYSISLKAGSEKELIKVANSAITQQ